MDITDKLRDISFHDSNIVRVSCHDSEIKLYFEDVEYDELTTSMLLKITNVTDISKDDVPINFLSMEATNGEVLDLNIDNTVVTIILNWHSYKPRSHVTCAYKISGPILRCYLEQND